MDPAAFRAHIPVTERWAYMDHAAVSPLSGPAHAALAEWADDMTANGVVNESRWLRRIEQVRGRFAELLHANPQEIAFVKNTSEGIGLVAEGVRWNPGDNVVTVADEYPANLYPWMNLAERGVEVRRVPSRQGRIVLDDLAAATDGRTRLLTISFIEFSTGFRNDLDAIGQLCRERGILFFVDAIQGLGAFPLDVSRTPIDFLAADGHKWLLGPEGAAVLWIRQERLAELRPLGVGWHSVTGAWDFSTIDFRLKPHAGRYESGSFNVGGLAALGASLDLLLGLEIENVAGRILALTDLLCQQVEKTGWTVYSSRHGHERSGIVSLVPPEGREPATVMKELRREGIVVNQRAGRLRISPHAYNTDEEIGRLVSLLGGLS